MIIDTDIQNLPLCPNMTNPVHPLHQQHTNLQNAAYESNLRNEDGEFESTQAEKMYESIAYGRFSGRMYLYKEETTISYRRDIITISSWYFRCYICGLVIPAMAKS